MKVTWDSTLPLLQSASMTNDTFWNMNNFQRWKAADLRTFILTTCLKCHSIVISFENGLFLVGYQWVMGKICKGAFVIYSPDKKQRQPTQENIKSQNPNSTKNGNWTTRGQNLILFSNLKTVSSNHDDDPNKIWEKERHCCWRPMAKSGFSGRISAKHLQIVTWPYPGCCLGSMTIIFIVIGRFSCVGTLQHCFSPLFVWLCLLLDTIRALDFTGAFDTILEHCSIHIFSQGITVIIRFQMASLQMYIITFRN